MGRIKGIVNGEITHLYWREGRWYWKVTGNPGIFFTGIGGDGIFYDAGSETQQIAGSIEFSSCETESGMRRKLARYFAQFQ